ncbi:MAG: sugar phosphate isomerase/epimerase [Kiritimatiellae bacterium]|nr:sugar phosphate isomerase/epimerase [Kiritimatiellia bacterium]
MRVGHHFYNWPHDWTDLDKRLQLTKETGYAGWEAKPNEIGAPAETVKAKCDALGIECAAIGAGGREGIDYAHAAGARVLRATVSKEECLELVDYAAERGIVLAVHNHLSVKTRGKGAIETREDLLRYLDERPGTYACPDTGHLLLCGSDPVRTIRDLGERVGYVHLKDIDPAAVGKADKGGDNFWEIGAGALDLDGTLEALQAIGYDGWLMIERDRRVADTVASAKRMRDTLRRLGY